MKVFYPDLISCSLTAEQHHTKASETQLGFIVIALGEEFLS
ncbi:MAG: hypothetical protein QXV06_03980 [Ignisphaera sp.]